MGATESQVHTATEPIEIAALSVRGPHRMFFGENRVFHSLMHHINVETLNACFERLSGRKAIGVDGVSKEQYGENLRANLEDLIGRMKRMAYRPGPVRQVLIPKEGKRNETRPLGVSNVEDKLVQMKVHEILEGIYDPIFLTCSYGFRPGMGCHDAIKDLRQHLFDHEVETVIDVDLSNYFGSIDRELLKEFLQIKIKDTRFLRYIGRMFKAGVLADGELTISEIGVCQGSACSPILANIYAHYVIDTWFEEICQKGEHGLMRMFRYSDDIVICCRYDRDARWMKEALANRLAEFKLTLNQDKTKLVKFSKSQRCRGTKQEAFDFLGFTFYLGQSHVGRIIPKVKTIGKRLRAKLKKVNEWARIIRNVMPLKYIWKIFCAKLRGHIQYYGVSFNYKAIGMFRWQCIKIMFKWLNRRSQRKSFTWEKFGLFLKRYPPPEAKIIHHLF